MPLTERTWAAPAMLPTSMDPDVVEISVSPVPPTLMCPLVVETRHRPSHPSSSTPPETVRRSASATVSTRTEPLGRRDSDRAEKADQLNATRSGPDYDVGALRTSHVSESEGRPARILDCSVSGGDDGATAIDDDVRAGFEVTLTPPDAVDPARSRASAGGMAMCWHSRHHRRRRGRATEPVRWSSATARDADHRTSDAGAGHSGT